MLSLRHHAPTCNLNAPAPEVVRCTCGIRSNPKPSLPYSLVKLPPLVSVTA